MVDNVMIGGSCIFVEMRSRVEFICNCVKGARDNDSSSVVPAAPPHLLGRRFYSSRSCCTFKSRALFNIGPLLWWLCDLLRGSGLGQVNCDQFYLSCFIRGDKRDSLIINSSPSPPPLLLRNVLRRRTTLSK